MDVWTTDHLDRVCGRGNSSFRQFQEWAGISHLDQTAKYRHFLVHLYANLPYGANDEEILLALILAIPERRSILRDALAEQPGVRARIQAFLEAVNQHIFLDNLLRAHLTEDAIDVIIQPGSFSPPCNRATWDSHSQSNP